MATTWGLLEQFRNVRFLNVSKNQLKDLNDIRQMVFLQNLNASDNQLANGDVFSDAEVKFSYLEYINLSGNAIQQITFSNTPLLKSLSISKNKLREIEFKDTSQVTLLEIRDNLLTGAEFLRSIAKVEKIFAAQNYFEDLEEFGKLSHLKVLHLRKNQVKSLAQGFRALEYLNLRENCIREYEEIDKVKNYSSLRTFNFQQNPQPKQAPPTDPPQTAE